MKDNFAAVDTVLKYAPIDWTVAMNKEMFLKGRYPQIREAWEKEMQLLIDEIYTFNQPTKHRMAITVVQ